MATDPLRYKFRYDACKNKINSNITWHSMRCLSEFKQAKNSHIMFPFSIKRKQEAQKWVYSKFANARPLHCLKKITRSKYKHKQLTVTMPIKQHWAFHKTAIFEWRFQSEDICGIQQYCCCFYHADHLLTILSDLRIAILWDYFAALSVHAVLNSANGSL